MDVRCPKPLMSKVAKMAAALAAKRKQVRLRKSRRAILVRAGNMRHDAPLLHTVRVGAARELGGRACRDEPLRVNLSPAARAALFASVAAEYDDVQLSRSCCVTAPY